jgi:hypothetical protein
MSMNFLLVIAIFFLGYSLYVRYFPVMGIPCKGHASNEVVLDLREFNENGEVSDKAIRLPYSYLKRFKHEIPNQKLHVVAIDRLELNLGLRFLLKNGYKVSSYEIFDCPCRGKKKIGEYYMKN